MILTSNFKRKDGISPLRDTCEDTNYVFLDEKNEATFICKNCGNVVIRDLSNVIHAQTSIRVKCKCKCGYLFRVLVDRRRNYRKIVKLLGMCLYVKCSGHIKRRLITILDMSATGLQFSIYGPPEFKLRDKIIFQVRLDDRENTEIRGKGTVKRIRSNSVGIEFISNENPKKLLRYLTR